LTLASTLGWPTGTMLLEMRMTISAVEPGLKTMWPATSTAAGVVLGTLNSETQPPALTCSLRMGRVRTWCSTWVLTAPTPAVREMQRSLRPLERVLEQPLERLSLWPPAHP